MKIGDWRGAADDKLQRPILATWADEPLQQKTAHLVSSLAPRLYSLMCKRTHTYLLVYSGIPTNHLPGLICSEIQCFMKPLRYAFGRHRYDVPFALHFIIHPF